MNRRSFLIGTSAALLASRTAGAAERSISFADELDELIDFAMRHLGSLPGLSVAVASPDGFYVQASGVTNITTSERVSTDTAFYIASATKPLTALALAALAARGELDLDVTLAAFAPDAQWPSEVNAHQVTFRHLLAHSSGIANDGISFRLAYSGDHDPALLWQLLRSSSANADAPLGTFRYTNTGYNLATILTDRYIGIAWQDLLQREVFGPAGMTRSTARVSVGQAGGWSVARPHLSLPEGTSRIYLEKTDRTMQSAGGVIMSANDALRWLQLMLKSGVVNGRQAVDPRAVALTHRPVVNVIGSPGSYGRRAYALGWYHGLYRDEPLLHHFGSFPGARSHVSFLPSRGIGVAAFTNNSGAVAEITDAIANFVYDRSAGRQGARQTFLTEVERLIARRDEQLSQMLAGKKDRAGRATTLGRPSRMYEGVYKNDQFGRVRIYDRSPDLNVAIGLLHATSEPGANAETIRVELLPGSGHTIRFEGTGSSPSNLVYQGETFVRSG